MDDKAMTRAAQIALEGQIEQTRRCLALPGSLDGADEIPDVEPVDGLSPVEAYCHWLAVEALREDAEIEMKDAA